MALLSALGSHHVKVVYGMGLGTAGIGQTPLIADKILTLYGEGGPAIGPSQALVLDATVRSKAQVKNLTAQEVQTGLSNGHKVDQQIGRSINVTNEEEIIRIAPIPAYTVYNGFECDLNAAMVYERLVDSLD